MRPGRRGWAKPCSNDSLPDPAESTDPRTCGYTTPHSTIPIRNPRCALPGEATGFGRGGLVPCARRFVRAIRWAPHGDRMLRPLQASPRYPRVAQFDVSRRRGHRRSRCLAPAASPPGPLPAGEAGTSNARPSRGGTVSVSTRVGP